MKVATHIGTFPMWGLFPRHVRSTSLQARPRCKPRAGKALALDYYTHASSSKVRRLRVYGGRQASVVITSVSVSGIEYVLIGSLLR